jgi:hypothetical protein
MIRGITVSNLAVSSTRLANREINKHLGKRNLVFARVAGLLEIDELVPDELLGEKICDHVLKIR